MSIMVCSCGYDMHVVQTGIGVDYGNGHVYPGDLWQCLNCGNKTIHTIGRAVYDGQYNQHEYYIYSIKKNNGPCAPDKKLWSNKDKVR